MKLRGNLLDHLIWEKLRAGLGVVYWVWRWHIHSHHHLAHMAPKACGWMCSVDGFQPPSGYTEKCKGFGFTQHGNPEQDPLLSREGGFRGGCAAIVCFSFLICWLGLLKDCRAGHVFVSIKLCCLFGANICHLPQLLPKGWPCQPHSTQWVLENLLVSPASSPLCRNDAAHFHQFQQRPRSDEKSKTRVWVRF